MQSIKKNFLFNVLITLSTYIINLALFPYVSRVLGVDIVGRIGFANNIISYFSIFALWGISNVGIREIAACGDDRERRSQVFSSIFSLLLLLTMATTLIYLLCIMVIPKFHAIKELLFFGTATLFFTSLLVEWLYQGLENFKYITVRTIIIRLVYAASVFLTIKSPDDYILYYFLTVLVVVSNSIINLSYSRYFVDFSLKNLSLRKYFKPVFSLGIYKIMVSMYTTFNVIYLGLVCNEKEVGYYYTSIKIFYILLGIMAAFTGVMLPRMSSLLSSEKEKEFKKYISYSFDFVFAFTIPIIVGCTILAPQIIDILAGEGFQGAILPMQLIMPILLLSGMAQIYIIQVLMPLKKDDVIMKSSIIGAIVGIVSNLLLVHLYGAVGSAVVLLISEVCGDLYCFIYALSKKFIVFPLSRFVSYLFSSIPYVVICLFVVRLFNSPIVILCLAILICLLYFFVQHRFILTKSMVGQSIAKYVY